MNRFQRAVGLLAVGFSALSFSAAFAQDAADIPQITIERTADDYVVPATLPEGIVTVNWTNTATEAPVSIVFARLNEGVEVDAFLETFGTQGPGAAMSMVALVGGAQVAPSETGAVTYNFTPGTYVLLDIAGEAPIVKPFVVEDAEGEGAAAPEGEVEVRLLDYAISLPPTLTAGTQTLQVENQGDQWHEMGIYRIDDAMASADIHALVHQMSSGDVDPATLPAEEVAFVPPMTQGEQVWLDVDLEPGTYLLLCFLPDLLGEGHAHVDLGMMQVITVAE